MLSVYSESRMANLYKWIGHTNDILNLKKKNWVTNFIKTFTICWQTCQNCVAYCENHLSTFTQMCNKLPWDLFSYKSQVICCAFWLNNIYIIS